MNNEELKELKNNFRNNHAARMVNLKKASESLEKTQAQKSKNTKNTETLRKLNDLLASL